MRIFFIVAAAVLFADFVESGLKRWDRIMTRSVEKAVGVTEEQYEDQYLKKHPKSKMMLLPFIWLLVLAVGFLWAIFSR